MAEVRDGYVRYSVSLVTQGDHRFYTLTMPSDVLATSCFVTTRDEDPKRGFQRVLDKNRAKEIADYIDKGFGTIPNSIVLSAQPEAELKVVGGGKTIEFRVTNKAFLVLDGQHRVYGFSLAQTSLRVPVVIYNSLSRQDETRLFIDINTKQRPVPNELLLDIKSLADYESETEQMLRELYDAFNTRKDSPLLGLLSPAARMSGRISRVTFNAAVKPLVAAFADSPQATIYSALNAYLTAVTTGLSDAGLDGAITNSTLFRAFMMLFVDSAQRVQDRHNSRYTADNFYDVLEPVFEKKSLLRKPGGSVRELYDDFASHLKGGFKL